ncbi:TetR/AcrR family transcriptional regulator [Pseudoalteromonas ostreae]|uniref:TetR/AcrR family transcriptional regulator n=1 Tax=Pseudoalteromonas ostreae TaxID=2774154 RepID=UPI001B37FD79|nr:TetR/AcrR family transcriptional regulator [Pseudoalteromonas ostreae]
MKSPRADAQRKRDYILQSSMHWLAQHPNGALEDLRKAINVGRTTLYRHFNNRETFIASVYAYTFKHAVLQLQEGNFVHCKIPELAEHLVDNTIRLVRNFPLLINGPGVDITQNGSMEEGYEQVLLTIELGIQRAQANQLLNPRLPSKWLASTLLDQCAGAVFYQDMLTEYGQVPNKLIKHSFFRAWQAEDV